MADGHVFNAPLADQYPVFVIQNAEVLGLFGWEQKDRKYFSYAELSPFLRQIEEQGALSEKLQSVERSAYQNAILNLRNGLVLYQTLEEQLATGRGAEISPESWNSYADGIPAAGKAARATRDGEEFRQDQTRQDGRIGRALPENMPRWATSSPSRRVPRKKRDWHSVGESSCSRSQRAKFIRS